MINCEGNAFLGGRKEGSVSTLYLYLPLRVLLTLNCTSSVSVHTTCEPSTFHILFVSPETNLEVFRSHRHDPKIAMQEF